MKKINTLQFCSCFIMIFISPFMGIGIYSLIKYSGLNLLLSLFLSLILSTLFMYIFLTIFNYEPNYNIKEKLNKLFNKYISYTIIFIISLCIFILGIILNYDFNNFIISQFLSETPMFIIASLFALLFYYINNKGYESIIRVSTILFFINIILFILVLICNIKGFNLDNFKPLIINTKEIYKGSIYIIGIPLSLISMLLIVPKNIIAENKKTDKNIYISLIISYIFMFTISILTIGILSINLAKLYQYPSYMFLKNISFLNVFDRIENIIIIEWIFQIFISISFIINYISKLLKIKHYIINLLLLTTSLLFFKNNTFFYSFSTTIIPYISFTLLLIMLLTFLQIKRKKNLS